MPQLFEVRLRHGVGRNATRAHKLVLAPCSQSETRTLYYVHDVGGKRITILTDDQHYDPRVWGVNALNVRHRAYNPSPATGMVLPFRIRLDRERRGGRQAYHTEDQIEGLAHELFSRNGALILDYDFRFDHTFQIGDATNALPTVTLWGRLKVEDASLLHRAMLTGIGRAKRFGCGLLLHP